VHFLGEEVIAVMRSEISLKRFFGRLLVPTPETKVFGKTFDNNFYFSYFRFVPIFYL